MARAGPARWRLAGKPLDGIGRALAWWGAMRQEDIWDEERAQRYDTAATAMFAPEVLGPAVDRLAELAGDGRALEFAVGTGRVAIPLAERGVPVTGIELSHPMIGQLRAKADESTIPVIAGDMATTRAPGTYTLVYLVYNTISNLLTQGEQVACFRNAARHLMPGGRFVIELSQPMIDRLRARAAQASARPAGRRLAVRPRLHRPGHLRRAASARRLSPLQVRREQRSPAVPQPEIGRAHV